MYDEQGQPTNTNFNKSRNISKSLMSLQGILKGVSSDHVLNTQEVLFLDAWLKSHSQLPIEGDVLDLTEEVKIILNSKSVTQDQLEDLKSQIEDVIDYGELVPNGVEDLINELLGFISGISADNIVTSDELISLAEWLRENKESTFHWPGNILYKKIANILDDGIIDDHELRDFTETCKMIAGQQFLETGAAHGMATEFCAQLLTALPTSIKSVCFTGKFISGTRAQMNAEAKTIGLKSVKDITRNLNLLVIGSLASPDWRFSSHGRKIEQAIKNQMDGCDTLIITEDNWKSIIPV
jgi:NAD-dependent DNA ligase